MRLRSTLMAMGFAGIIIGVFGCGSEPEKPSAPSTIQSDLNQVDKPESPSAATDDQSADAAQSQAQPPKEQQKINPVQTSGGVQDDLYRKFNEARQAGSLSSATAAAGEILTRNPNDTKVLNALAVMAIAQEKYDLARLYLAKVLEKDPNSAAAYDNLGVIELKTDNLRMALAQFKKATEMDPRSRTAHANLGSIYLQYRNYPNAVAELEAAVENGDQSPAALSNLGYALTGAGDYAKASDAYEKALSKDETNVTIMLNYAALLVQHNLSKDKATKLLNKIRFVAHEPAILNKVEALLRKVQGGSGKPPVDKGELD